LVLTTVARYAHFSPDLRVTAPARLPHFTEELSLPSESDKHWGMGGSIRANGWKGHLAREVGQYQTPLQESPLREGFIVARRVSQRPSPVHPGGAEEHPGGFPFEIFHPKSPRSIFPAPAGDPSFRFRLRDVR